MGDASPRRHHHVPQLGPPRAPADLRRRAAGLRPRGPDPMTPSPLAGAATRRIIIDNCLGDGEHRTLADDVLDGLTRPFKELPPKHFYDARGADLFDQICDLPEYYPTRCERAILQERSAEIV